MGFLVTWKSDGYTFDVSFDTEDDANVKASNLRQVPGVTDVAVFREGTFSR
jgi:hypothetical protein